MVQPKKSWKKVCSLYDYSATAVQCSKNNYSLFSDQASTRIGRHSKDHNIQTKPGTFEVEGNVRSYVQLSFDVVLHRNAVRLHFIDVYSFIRTSGS